MAAMYSQFTGAEHLERNAVGLLLTVGLTLLVWHFTGVLQPVINWFKGKE